MSNRATCGIGALALGAVLPFTSIAIAQTTYYVNGSCGDDSWTGLSPACEAPNGPKATIQEGINAADHFDSVQVADGIYTGPGNKNLEFFQKEMSIRSSGGPEQCIIDCENDGLGFTFCTLPDDRPVTIEGFTIRNGRGTFAGGICIAAAEVTIDNCVIERCVGTGQNAQYAAGAICIIRSPAMILRTTLRNNVAEGRGGSGAYGGGVGVYDDSLLAIEDSLIEHNQAGIESLFTGGWGGGVNVGQFSQIQMSRCIVANNRVLGGLISGGGGLSVAGRTLEPSIIRDTEFRNNQVFDSQGQLAGSGGGAHLEDPTILQNCMAVGNSAASGGGFSFTRRINEVLEAHDVVAIENRARLDGGGLIIRGVTLDGLRLMRNVAERDGGGLLVLHSESILNGASFMDNVAARNGGGLYASSRFDLRWAAFSGNSAGADGGGIFAETGLGLVSALIINNRAAGRGGGIFVRTLDELTALNEVTAVRNEAPAGGGVYLYGTTVNQTPVIANTIVRENIPDAVIDNSGTLEITRSNIDDGWPGVGNLDVDPGFVDPLNSDYRLAAGSPCIDAGDNRFVVSEADLAGEPRRVDDAGMPDAGVASAPIVDMGCYEFQGTSTGFIVVHPRPGVAGRDNQLQAAGATPGNVVYFVYGFATGSTGVPGCPGLTIDIANPRIAAQSTADATGYASKIINIPIAGSGRAIILQAVDRDACAVSTAVGYRFP